MAKGLEISCRATPETQEDAIKVMEVLSRACVGLGLDGLTTTISFITFDYEE
jgi:hypothetical protein